MTIERILEDEIMDTVSAAQDYDAMNHATVNRAFADDLVAFSLKLEKPWEMFSISVPEPR